MIQCDHFKIHAPSNWLIFSLILCSSLNYKQVSSYEECVKLAQECGISGSDVDQALHFIQLTMGLIRHFPHDSDLKNIVITDPLILFEKVTNLLVKTFTFERAGKQPSDDFKKGIFSHDEFEKCSSESSDPLSCSQFLKILKLLRIVCPFQDTQDIVHYFFPCAITHVTEQADLPDYESLAAPPLLISFFYCDFVPQACGFVPKGFSSALIVFLMTNEMNSSLRWELQPQCIFRDQVTFFINPSCDKIALRILPTHLEIIFLSDPSREQDNDIDDFPLESTCFELCKSIKAAIDAITSNLVYINTKPSLTYYCCATGCCGQHPARPICVDGSFAPRKLICPKSSSISVFPQKHQIWCLQKLASTVNIQVDSDIVKPTSESRPLTPADAFVQLLPLASKWKNIGTVLDLDSGALDTIEYNESGKAEDCLREMLHLWIRQINPRPSWSALVEAIELFDPKKALGIKIFSTTTRVIDAEVSKSVDDSCNPSTSAAAVDCSVRNVNVHIVKTLKRKRLRKSVSDSMATIKRAKIYSSKRESLGEVRRGTKRKRKDDSADDHSRQ